MKSPAFQFYPCDWLSSRAVKLMDAEQRGWYIQLLAEAWQSRPQATLPNDPKLLIRLAEANTQSVDFESRWAFVVGQFKVKGELLVNARLAKEKKKQIDYHEQRKQAGEKGAARRWRRSAADAPDTSKNGNSSAIAKPSPRHASANGESMPLQSSSSIPTSDKAFASANGTRRDLLFEALTSVCRVDWKICTKDQRGALNQTVGLLRENGHTAEEVQRFGEWWFGHDWRGKQGQAPLPHQVRDVWQQAFTNQPIRDEHPNAYRKGKNIV